MPQSQDDTQDNPRIVVALPKGPLRDRVLALLRDRDLDVDTELEVDALGSRIEASDSAVVIVRHEDLSEEDTRRLDGIAENQEAPDVVVVGPGLDEAERVDLVHAGATEVLDAARLDVRAGDAIETLASGEGGHATPDTGSGPAPSLSDFSPRSKAMHALVDLAGRVAPTDSTVLISGETGVGKEHLARAIHAAGPRADAPFEAVNCGALPPDLIESELFGHAKGAFTGAKGDRRGFFQAADGGSLLLDEIGELPRHLQVKLLRVLQRGEVRPVGAETDVQLDVRVFAATNRDLQAEVAEGRFREDLYFRLNVVELVIPPLRERPEDLATLIGSLLRHFKAGMDRDDLEGLDDEALDALLRYSWPGNVRELSNALERAMLVCRGPLIGTGDLPPSITGEAPPAGTEPQPLGALPPALLEKPWREVRKAALHATERTYFEALLRECRGQVGAAAERAGLSSRSLYDKLKQHGLRKEDFR